MFSSGSLSSISLATVTPSLVMTGEPNFLSRTTFRPLGPSVTFTASARRFTPRRTACRDSSPYVICFAIENGLLFLADHREDLVLTEDEVLLAVDLDVGSRVLAEEDLVCGLDVERHLGPVLEDLAVADGDHLSLLRLLLGRIGNDDAALDGLLLLDAPDQ